MRHFFSQGRGIPFRLIITLSLCGLLFAAPESHASGIIGQKRFLPMNQQSLKHKAAIVVSAREGGSAQQPSHSLRPSGQFLPIRRQVHMIQRNTQKASRYITRELAKKSRSTPLVTAQAQSNALPEVTDYNSTHRTKGDALLDLFSGQDKIEASHPFLQ